MEDIYLQQLTLYNFKCYPQASLGIRERIVCFLGENGSGKTNLLDAIHYQCFSKSYFNTADSQNIRFSEEQAGITGSWMRGQLPEEVICAIRKGQRKVLKRNHKEYDKLSDHIGLLPAVLITPYDIELILEGSEVRRKFMDATISQSSHPYLDHLLNYNQALQQRNNLLKQFAQRMPYNSDLLDPWDHRLVHHGEAIHSERSKFFADFLPLFQEIYTVISGAKEIPNIAYQTDFEKGSFAQLLIDNRDRDRILERTSAGIHKDELDFELDGYTLKKFASQGQQKSFLIALKLAQFLFIRNHTELNPLLMLDDLFDKLDEGRVSNLLSWIREHKPGQVFITDTDLVRIPRLLSNLDLAHEAWHVSAGEARPLEINFIIPA